MLQDKQVTSPLEAGRASYWITAEIYWWRQLHYTLMEKVSPLSKE